MILLAPESPSRGYDTHWELGFCPIGGQLVMFGGRGVSQEEKSWKDSCAMAQSQKMILFHIVPQV